MGLETYTGKLASFTVFPADAKKGYPAQRGVCVCVNHLFAKVFLLLHLHLQGHQGCMTWPGATKLQSCIRIWLKDASATYLQRQPPEVPKIRK